MNLQRKLDIQKRKSETLQSQISKLKYENYILRVENNALTESIAMFDRKVKDMEKLRTEYESYISEAIRIKNLYKDAIEEVTQIKKEYRKKLDRLLHSK